MHPRLDPAPQVRNNDEKAQGNQQRFSMLGCTLDSARGALSPMAQTRRHLQREQGGEEMDQDAEKNCSSMEMEDETVQDIEGETERERCAEFRAVQPFIKVSGPTAPPRGPSPDRST
ncbi:hypothetical protein NQZ68_031913 [Dissostichus eleginoides]|nr:hypothetical protein NQZ68_031913 [Dissostichus eleginoides]